MYDEHHGTKACNHTETPERQTPWVWVADFETGKISRRAPKNIASRPGYYALPNRPGLPPNVAEESLGKIESATAPVVAKLRAGDLNLGGQDWAELHFFMAFFAVRVPAFRDNIEDFAGRVVTQMAQMMASQAEYCERTFREANPDNALAPEEIEEARRGMLEGRYRIRGTPILSLSVGMESALKTVYPIFSKMKWAILRAPNGGRFITSDCPVSWFDPTPRPPFYAGHGLGMKKVQVTFPVSPALCLFGGWLESKRPVIAVDGQTVEAVNWRRVAFADRHAYASTQEGASFAVEAHRRMTGKEEGGGQTKPPARATE